MITALDPDLLQQLTRLDGDRPSTATRQLDDDLATAIRHTGYMRRLFYGAVLIVALYGSATGAVTAFDLPWWIAVGGIFALELGGVTFLSHADVRRRLGEHATAPRTLGAGIAGAAATFNLITHGDHLLGGFFALMSVLGFLSWWLDVENKRRDRLRCHGLLPPPTPKYELWAHWARHPVITGHARALAKAHPHLGLYGSLQAALIVRRRAQRDAALTRALRARIRGTIGKDLTRVAVLTYDMDEVGRRLRATADYDGLSALLASELTAEHVLHGQDDQPATAARTWLAHHAHTPDCVQTTSSGIPERPQPPARSTRADGAAHARRQPHPPGAKSDAGEQPAPAGLGTGPGPRTTQTAPRPPTPDRTVNGKAGSPPAAGASRALPAEHGTHAAVTVAITEPPHDHRADRPAPPNPARTGTTRATSPEPHPGRKVQVTILSEPAILDRAGQPVRGVRAKSRELLVYLAVNRNGAALTDILDAVWRDVPTERANQRLSTCLSNLRSVIRGVMDPTEPGQPHTTRRDPIVNTGGRYHLNPAILTVDWWHQIDHNLGDPAAETTPTNGAAATRIADGYHYPWLDIDPVGVQEW